MAFYWVEIGEIFTYCNNNLYYLIFKWELTRPLILSERIEWIKPNLRCSYGCLLVNLLKSLRKKHELSCLIIIFALQVFETALTSVMFSISSSSAARDGGQNVRFTFYLFFSIYFSFQFFVAAAQWLLHTSNMTI